MQQEDWADAADGALLRAARLGDQDAFAVVVERHGPGMLAYARRLTGDDGAAADAVQEAFVSAWRDLESFEGRSSLRTWLFRLTHRRAVDLVRRRRPVPVDDRLLVAADRGPGVDPLREVLDGELLEALQAALGELPWAQRAAWLLREVEEMDYAEIATALGTTVGSVRGHLHRARRTLSERMARWR